MQNLPSDPYKIKYPGLFASDSSAIVSDISTSDTDTEVMNFRDGIPQIYSKNPADGGKYLELGMVNAIGKMASVGPYYSQIGYVYTYEPEVAEVIGGYPKGAVLRYTNSAGESVLVLSLVGDNKNNFVSNPSLIDGVHWRNITTPANSRLSLFPDYSKREVVSHTNNVQKYYYDDTTLFEFTPAYDCFINICMRGYVAQIGSARSDIDIFMEDDGSYYRLTESLFVNDYYNTDSNSTSFCSIDNAGYYIRRGTKLCLRVVFDDGTKNLSISKIAVFFNCFPLVSI